MNLKSNTMEIPDMISSLPEPMLTHILSFVSTKESVSTSVLSTRWRNLFSYVPVLDFHLPGRYPNPKEFVKFVNRVLSLHDVFCTIRKFRIDMDHNPCNTADVCSWIIAAIRRHAQIIDARGINTEGVPCTLPNDLFTCQVLVELNLNGGFVFNVAGPVSLPSLKTVHISHCKFSNADSAKRLFASCPVLEDLCLLCCDSCDGSVISISVLSLKCLAIFGLLSSGCEWELNNVPNLETIYLLSTMNTAKCYSVNILKSLRKARIRGCSNEDYDMIWKLVNKFEEIQFLSLSGECMEPLARDSLSLPIFNKLTTLELMVDFSRGWKFLPILLERSSCLEHLTIDGDGFSNCDKEFLEIDILLPAQIPLCFSRSLKEVRLRMFKGGKVEYEWLGFLLENAKVLEKLAVSALLVDEGEEDFAYLGKVRKNLLALPTNSKNCQIVVTERDV